MPMLSYRIIMPHSLATKTTQIAKQGSSNRLVANKRLLEAHLRQGYGRSRQGFSVGALAKQMKSN
jgi:hypothetical protein